MRRAAGLLGLMAGVVLLSSCATTVSGSGVAAPGEVAAYRSQVSASRQAAVREAGAELCREAMSAMVVMVRGYNTFLDRLNQAHGYPGVGDLDDRARASLIAGSDKINRHVYDRTPADVRVPVQAFLESSDRLDDGIARKLLSGLNPLAAQWTGDKQRVLDSCTRYVPSPSAAPG